MTAVQTLGSLAHSSADLQVRPSIPAHVSVQIERRRLVDCLSRPCVITKRPERLKGVDYCGFERYFLTICTAFSGLQSLATRRTRSSRSCRKNAVRVPVPMASRLPPTVSCPIVFHALMEGLVENADFRRVVKIFKQVSAFIHRRETGSHLWRPGYHGRVVSDDEATEAIVRFVWENPIRAGLTKELERTRSADRTGISCPTSSMCGKEIGGLKTCATLPVARLQPLSSPRA